MTHPQNIAALSWNQAFNLSVFHVDHRGLANFYTYFNLMQEAAMQHAHHNKFGLDKMRSENKIWVVTRFELQLSEQLAWGDDIEIETWSRGLIGATAHREFSLYKFANPGEKKLIGRACSIWVPIDLQLRTVTSINPQDLAHVSLKEKTHEIKPRKIEFDEKLFQSVNQLTAKPSDIDLNQHVNNAKYVQWIYDSIAMNEHGELPKNGFSINYISEVNLAENIQIMRHGFKFAGVKASGKPAFTAEFF